MSLVVKSRSKSLKDTTVELDGSDKPSLGSILKKVSENNGKINPNRLRLTYLKESKQIPINSDTFFEDGLNVGGAQLFAKDLGPQISWRLVFLVEYLGPILIHSLLYYLSQQPYYLEKFHCKSVRYNPLLNRCVYSLVMIHYIKREFETLFIHQFSQSTMPLFNIFKNSFHYWVLNGAIALGYFGWGFVISDSKLFSFYSSIHLASLRTLIALFLLSECWNFYVHLKLRLWGDAQKAKGITTRVPIDSGLFKIFVAPNYTFEVFAWISFAMIFKLNAFSLIFVTVSSIQMYSWAQKKNRKYGTKRAFLIPFIF
ncbi:hypothetical protein HG535_0C02530 [Zygotorulaspora mrakii]|uniref:3-oxo-5-alpha-steroid 4-dehydrogenase C-terminal domain-containing protein n=1 Tax=Zygotorulaspora mrakii TaxID=42260 RepID=A0A7H9AZV7_ZYGMR|nr:uncharacterized protein HG535_0C02530 [Zygotorulaspora mrakii]QLG71901.1 hypothetical protein HG535_0C02530 [Zygotorulaspora mrakii]